MWFPGNPDPAMNTRSICALICLSLLIAILAGCQSSPPEVLEAPFPTASPTAPVEVSPYPTRSPFPPGELIEYEAQDGDTLSAVAAHFHTTAKEILSANPGVPPEVTTLPPGFPLQVPAYYVPLTGPPFNILPSSEFVNSPSAIDFDIREAILRHPGFLQSLSSYAYEVQRPAWGVVEVIAQSYSLHPRLLLTLLEFQSQALSNPFPSQQARDYPMGIVDPKHKGLFWQLVLAAERLSDGYYSWRDGSLQEFELTDGLLVRPDPWLNAPSAALQYFFADLMDMEAFNRAVGPEGLIRTYTQLWGPPSEFETTVFLGNTQQPELALPFQPNHIWHLSGGPHFGWGNALPMSALDFAPPAGEEGCVPSREWVAAPAGGMIVRSEPAIVVLDLDGDGLEQTGWTLFFFHMDSSDRIAAGTEVQQGDFLGHPSCEGGRATGTHVHVARRYNGEWIPADGVMPFTIDGWVAKAGAAPYEGSLTKGSRTIIACPCSSASNQILYQFP
jgi:LasA protease